MSGVTRRAGGILAAGGLIFAAPVLAQHEGPAMPPAQSETPDPADPHAGHDMGMDMPMTAPATDSAGDGDGHEGETATPPAPAAQQADAGPDDPHADHGTASGAAPAQDSDPHTGHDHHAGMAMPPPPAPDATGEASAPPAAGSGPPRAADAIWGAGAMRASRAANAREMGAMRWGWFMADRLEYRAGDGADLALWDVQGYWGGDMDKLWLKSEGEAAWGERVHDAEVQALWSHAVAPFFDLQAGVRQDLTGPGRTHAVIGLQGLAPYEFEIDAAAFLSDKGDLTARIEAELDQRITQKLILQPRAELDLSAQHIPELGVGAGLDKATLGLRLRYEFAREFAPYVGVEQSWRTGRGADYARAAGDDPSTTQVVVGVRLWF